MKRWLIVGGVVLALFAALVVVAALVPESPERLPGSITNPRPQGIRALGEVLQADGVDVRQVTGLDEATAAGAGSTLAVYLDDEFSDSALARLRDVPADLVLVYTATKDLASVGGLTEGRITVDDSYIDDEWVWADCNDPDALAARFITPSGWYGLRAWTNLVTTCFTVDEDASLYADTTTARHRVTVVAGDTWLRNDTITEQGNAALALRVFGRNQQLVWYLPGTETRPTDRPVGDSGFDLWSLLPPWANVVFAVLLAAAAAAALWRGRRFGALVREQLPVEVPASEVSSGLARLYRQSSARGHAAAALRAATIHRAAGRLGLLPSAGQALVVERLAQATGVDPVRLNHLCYGPPPLTDSALVELATDLSDLERKLTSRD